MYFDGTTTQKSQKTQRKCVFRVYHNPKKPKNEKKMYISLETEPQKAKKPKGNVYFECTKDQKDQERLTLISFFHDIKFQDENTFIEFPIPKMRTI